MFFFFRLPDSNQRLFKVYSAVSHVWEWALFSVDKVQSQCQEIYAAVIRFVLKGWTPSGSAVFRLTVFVLRSGPRGWPVVWLRLWTEWWNTWWGAWSPAPARSSPWAERLSLQVSSPWGDSLDVCCPRAMQICEVALILDLWPPPQITLWWNSHRNTPCCITASPQRARTTSQCRERPWPWRVSDVLTYDWEACEIEALVSSARLSERWQAVLQLHCVAGLALCCLLCSDLSGLTQRTEGEGSAMSTLAWCSPDFAAGSYRLVYPTARSPFSATAGYGGVACLLALARRWWSLYAAECGAKSVKMRRSSAAAPPEPGHPACTCCEYLGELRSR